jgi:hypothetical protein
VPQLSVVAEPCGTPLQSAHELPSPPHTSHASSVAVPPHTSLQSRVSVQHTPVQHQSGWFAVWVEMAAQPDLHVLESGSTGSAPVVHPASLQCHARAMSGVAARVYARDARDRGRGAVAHPAGSSVPLWRPNDT